MNKVKIVVDSTVDLNQEDYKNLDLEVISLFVRLGEKEYVDVKEISPDQIYEYVDKTGTLPATSTVSSGRFEEVYQKYIDQGFDIVFIGIGSGLSGTVQASNIAASSFPEGRIFTVDSQSLSTGSGLLVLKACKFRDEGKSAKEIYELLTDLTPKVVAQFGLTRLDYLAKGGRCSGFANLMSRFFHIHPLLRIVDGKLIVYRKPRGKVEAYFDELIELYKEDSPIDDDVVFITHSGIDQESIEYVKNKLETLVDPSHIKITRAAGIISCHCGPGTLGVLYIKK